MTGTSGCSARSSLKQRDAFLARGGLATEVHVLDDQVHFLGTHGREGLGRRCSAENPRAVQGQQDLEGRAHGLTIVSNQYGPVRQAVLDVRSD